jgi:hypothetical protein
MIPLCSRFDSVLFTPKMSAIASYGNFSRSPLDEQVPLSELEATANEFLALWGELSALAACNLPP